MHCVLVSLSIIAHMDDTRTAHLPCTNPRRGFLSSTSDSWPHVPDLPRFGPQGYFVSVSPPPRPRPCFSCSKLQPAAHPTAPTRAHVCVCVCVCVCVF